MSKKDIFWIKCVPSDFLSDIDLQCMDAEQRGVAFWLWMSLYCNNGKLKYDLKRLSNVCVCSQDIVDDVINDKFQIIDGFVTHKRVDAEIEDSQVRHDKAVKASKARWEKKSKSNAQALNKQSKSNAQASVEQCQYNTIQYNTTQTDNNNIKQTPAGEILEFFDNGKFSLDDCKNAAFKAGLSDEEAESMFHHFNSQGWTKTNGRPITDINSAMVNWKNYKPSFQQKEKANEPGGLSLANRIR